jgi:hypothetical protein
MTELKTPVVANTGVANAQPQATVVPALVIRAFLNSEKVAPAAGRASVEAAMASVVRVICVRK